MPSDQQRLIPDGDLYELARDLIEEFALRGYVIAARTRGRPTAYIAAQEIIARFFRELRDAETEVEA